MTDELFFDTDCLSAFLWIGNTNILQELYKGRIILPKVVYDELSNPCIPHLKQKVDNLVNSKDIILKDIEVGTEEFNLYLSLVNDDNPFSIGKGEASAIALSKVYNGILASNNYKDIQPYINKYHLKHLDAGMILKEALNKYIITEEQRNDLWKQMIKKRRKLPTNTFSEYLHRA